MENDADSMTMPRADAADTMPETHAIDTASALHGTIVNRKNHPISLTSANTMRTAQELILRESLGRLSANAQLAVALLSLTRIPLSEPECLDFLSARGTFRSTATSAAAVRELQDWGVVQRLMAGALVCTTCLS